MAQLPVGHEALPQLPQVPRWGCKAQEEEDTTSIQPAKAYNCHDVRILGKALHAVSEGP